MAGLHDYYYFDPYLRESAGAMGAGAPDEQDIDTGDPYNRPSKSPGPGPVDYHYQNLHLGGLGGDRGAGAGAGVHLHDSSPENGNSSYFSTEKSIGLLSVVADNVLSHPFSVLRRQCQVHVNSRRYHLSPFTLVYPVWHLCGTQGAGVLWKGLGSCLLVRGMTMGVEDVLSKVTRLPNEISRHSSLKSVSKHILLKAISLAIITPFYSASLVETVQSEVASDSAGFLDVFREGLRRLCSWPSTGRLVPLHTLVLPTVGYGLASYLIYTGIRSVSLATIRRVRENKERNAGAVSKDSGISIFGDLTASLIGHMTADAILFPLETVLHRLHLQGTRTIVDSLDCGYEVTPIITSYSGVLDCFRSTIEEEGCAGLYKGFGALVLQYGLQILLIRMVKILVERVSPVVPVVPPAPELSETRGHSTHLPARPSSSQQIHTDDYHHHQGQLRRPQSTTFSDTEVNWAGAAAPGPKFRSPYTHYSP